MGLNIKVTLEARQKMFGLNNNIKICKGLKKLEMVCAEDNMSYKQEN